MPRIVHCGAPSLRVLPTNLENASNLIGKRKDGEMQKTLMDRFFGSYALLLLVFALACVLGYAVVRDAVNKTLAHQALAIAENVASQATTGRSVFAKEVAAKLKADDRAACLAAGIGDHMAKPLQADALWDVLKTWSSS